MPKPAPRCVSATRCAMTSWTVPGPKSPGRASAVRATACCIRAPLHRPARALHPTRVPAMLPKPCAGTLGWMNFSSLRRGCMTWQDRVMLSLHGPRGDDKMQSEMLRKAAVIANFLQRMQAYQCKRNNPQIRNHFNRMIIMGLQPYGRFWHVDCHILFVLRGGNKGLSPNKLPACQASDLPLQDSLGRLVCV